MLYKQVWSDIGPGFGWGLGEGGVQFFEQLDCAVHGLRGSVAAFRGPFFDATGFVGVVARVVIVQFLIFVRFDSKPSSFVNWTLLPIHSSHFIFRNPIVTKYFLLHIILSDQPRNRRGEIHTVHIEKAYTTTASSSSHPNPHTVLVLVF
jgi:hypothetical protein